ncbi:integral membrane protein [Actinomadura verrucosospora]|uniref:Integral membrane protein n=1 Tax=Actinomadura verrucosospora TaxID=46165 RepID=A0A7D4A1X5_ACTVE|nr:integral membrane protein [Actinomadura verrucosospora]
MPEPDTGVTGEPAAARTGGERVRTGTGSGPGRLLVAVYAIFALAAGARAGVQIGTRFSEAPLAYSLSAFAAAVYVLATVALARGGRTSFRVAVTACSVELAGVLAIGTLSLVDRSAFPDATVWSGYGEGYGFVPLVLPVVGLLWLRRTARRARAGG